MNTITEVDPTVFAKFEIDLTQALEIYHNTNERAGIACILRALMAFMQNVPLIGDKGLAMVLAPILSGIEQLDSGTKILLFEPRKRQKVQIEIDPPLKVSNSLESLLRGLEMAWQCKQRKDDLIGYLIAIASFIEYIRSKPELDKDLVIPLERLASGLKLLLNGQSDPLFERQKRKGRPPNNDFDDVVKAVACAVVDALMKAGCSMPNALSKVARELQIQGLHLRGHAENLSDTLQGLRAGISRGDRSKQFMAVYDTISEHLSQSSYPSPDAAWKDLKPKVQGIVRGGGSAMPRNRD